MTDLSRLSIDHDGRLYWDGKPVEVRRRISMSRAQVVGASIVAAFVVIGRGRVGRSRSRGGTRNSPAGSAGRPAPARRPEGFHPRNGSISRPDVITSLPASRW